MGKQVLLAPGFTLAELLISLAILGVIATFTIPKILSTQQNSSNIAKMKETAATLSAAFQQAKLAGTITSTTKPSDLTPYINYVSIDTSGTVVDDLNGGTSTTCNNSYPCIKLHNGVIIRADDLAAFGGTATTNCINFRIDPEPGYSGTTNPVRAVGIFLYYDGYMTSQSFIRANSYTSAGGPYNPGNFDPPWFSWQ